MSHTEAGSRAQARKTSVPARSVSGERRTNEAASGPLRWRPAAPWETEPLSHTLSDPLVLLLLAGALALVVKLRSRRWGLFLLAAVALTLFVISTPLVSGGLLHALQARVHGPSEEQRKGAGAIVVLSAGLRFSAEEFGGDTVGPLTLERIRYGARLHRQTGLPLLVTGAHSGGSRRPLALAMAEALETDFQVPVRWRETKARNTQENAFLSAKMLENESIESAYVVTHAWYMARTIEAFGRTGIEALPAPTAGVSLAPGISIFDFIPTSKGLRNSAYAVHEWLGLYWYRFKYD